MKQTSYTPDITETPNNIEPNPNKEETRAQWLKRGFEKIGYCRSMVA